MSESGKCLIDEDEELAEEEEGDLSDRFKAHLGLLGQERVSEQGEVCIPWSEEKEGTISKHKFSDFAKLNFRKGSTAAFSKEPLKEPLLAKRHKFDVKASIRLWIAIQRFMGDVEIPPEDLETRGRLPVMSKVYKAVEQYRVNNKHEIESEDGTKDAREHVSFKTQKSSFKKLMGMKQNEKEKEKEKDKEKEKSKKEGSTNEGYSKQNDDEIELLLSVPTGEMDLIHYIIGHPILRRDLRDEVICQICKQLTGNTEVESQKRGWILLALCVGCVHPSEKLMMSFRCFLQEASPEFKEYASYTRRTLKRTVKNGIRYHPPNWLELQAVTSRKYIMLPVTLSDNSVQTLETDSATTAVEMCQKIAENVGLKDLFGFSVYISIGDKVSSLGSGLDHVMDAISECEQVARSKGLKEEDAEWRLFFRKELFTPWHKPASDPVATGLIFRQFARGVRSQEYKLKRDEDIVKIVARRYYVENGSDIVPGKLQGDLHKLMPESALKGSKSRESWTQSIIAAIDELATKKKQTQQETKEELVMLAARKWPLQFAGLFEAFRMNGPVLPKNEVVLGVGSRGFFILEDPCKLVLSMPFYDLIRAKHSRSKKIRGQTVSILTITGDEYVFLSPNSETVSYLINHFIEGLRHRSKYAVGLQEFVLQGSGVDEFHFKKGDILTLFEPDKAQDKMTKPNWCWGTCERTKKKKVPTATLR